MTIEELAQAVPQGAILGLDLSRKAIGLSISDTARNLAVPLTMISRTKLVADIAALQKIIAEREITGLVLGLPLNMDGTEGPRAQSVRTFASNLRKEISQPVVFWDERLSTYEAGQILNEADIPPAKQAARMDAAAAAIILQGALDWLKTVKP